MKSTMQYSVGGEIFDVADDRRDEFFADVEKDYGEEPEEVYTFWVDGKPIQVKASRVDEFLADCDADGATARKTRAFKMDDGEVLRVGDEDARQFVNARRTGQAMSRGLLKQTGIPEQYGRSAADREALADALGAFYPEERVDYGDKKYDVEENLGDALLKGGKTAAKIAGDVASEALMAPGSATRRWMDEGAERGEYLPTAVKNANAYAGKLAAGFANLIPAATDVVGQALGGEDTAAGRYMRRSAQAGRGAIEGAIDQETPYLETGSEVGNSVVNKGNEFMADTGATIAKFAVPGAAAVDISANAANTYYDAYQQAIKNGADAKKAEALAAAKAGVGAFEGIVLAQSAQGSGGVRGFLGRVASVAKKMGGAAVARDIVEQGIEGKKNPDVLRSVKKGLLAGAEGATFEAVSGAVHAGQRKLAGVKNDFGEAKFREDKAREEKRKDARVAYDSTVSDETAWQIDKAIQEQVDAGTISERSKDRVKERVMTLFENPRSLDDAELREMAVLKAATEENTRRETPTRVESAAHERRTVDEKMRENEYRARLSEARAEEVRRAEEEKATEEKKRAEEYYKDESEQELADTERKGAEINADLDAQRAAYERRKKDIEVAFARGDTEAVAKLMAEQKAEMDAYMKAEEERKRREAEEEGTLQPQEYSIRVEEPKEDDAVGFRQSPEYKSWLKKKGRVDSDKNWNRYVAEAELDPALRVDRGRNGDTEEAWRRGEIKDEVSGAIEDIRNRIIDRDAKEKERNARKSDIEAAFNDFVEPQEAKPDGKGKMVKPNARAEITEEQRRVVAEDAEMRSIIEKAKKVTTSDERDAVQSAFEARWRELFGAGDTEAGVADTTTTSMPVGKATGGRGEPVEVANGGLGTSKPQEASKEVIRVEPKGNIEKSVSSGDNGIKNDGVTQEGVTKVPDGKGGMRPTKIGFQKAVAKNKYAKARQRFMADVRPGGIMDFLEEFGHFKKTFKSRWTRDSATWKKVKHYNDSAAGDALENFFDGMNETERKKWESRIFGNKSAKDSTGKQGNDVLLDALRERYGESMTIDEALHRLRSEWEEFEDYYYNGCKTNAEIREEQIREHEIELGRDAEIKVDGESYDIEEAEARKNYDDVYNGAVAEVSKFDGNSQVVQNFSRDQLTNIRKGDRLRFDHSEVEWIADNDFDAKNGEIVVSGDSIADNPLFTEAEKADMMGRRFRITDKGWIELKEKGKINEPENSERADKTKLGDAQGKRGGQKGGEDFRLEGGTAEEIASEKRRIAEKKEIQRRLDAPLKTGKGEIGQDLLDLGGAEGGDLFNTARPSISKDNSKAGNARSEVAKPSVDDARSLLKEKFYQSSDALIKQRDALPEQATKLRAAYDIAIEEAKKRATGKGDSNEAPEYPDEPKVIVKRPDGKGRMVNANKSPAEKTDKRDADNEKTTNVARDEYKYHHKIGEETIDTNLDIAEYKKASNEYGHIVNAEYDLSKNISQGRIDNAKDALRRLEKYVGIMSKRNPQIASDYESYISAVKDALSEMSVIKWKMERERKGRSFIKKIRENDRKTPVYGSVLDTLRGNVIKGNASKPDAKPTDAGFNAWAVGRDGKPIAYATKEAADEARAIFEKEVKAGKVDGKTGKILLQADGAERIEMRNLDPNLRSEQKVVDWAKKRGRAVPTVNGKPTVDVETMREYNRDRAMKAANMVKRAFPGMTITYHDKPEGVERGKHDIALRDRHGHSLGWYSPSDKHVALLPGADAETVAHEIGWHAVRDWASERARSGGVAEKKLLDAMHDVENNVPASLRTKVLRLYRKEPGYTRDNLLNEFGAWDFMRVGGLVLEEAMTTREAQKWYAKAITTVKDVYKDWASAHGMNRVDLAQIDGMSRDQFKAFIAKQLMEGKTFGEVHDRSGSKPISTNETVFGKLKRRISDINAPLQEMVKRVEKKSGMRFTSDDNVADEAARKVGYLEAAHMKFKNKLNAFRDMLGDTGLSEEQIGYYMACKAAAGRDAKVDARNIAELVAKSRTDAMREIHKKEVEAGRALDNSERQQIYDKYAKAAVDNYVSTNGSGIRPEEARQQIAEIENGSKGAEYKKCAKYLRDIINETLDIQDNTGLVDKKESAKWRAEEPEYVPYKSAVAEETGEYYGRGLDFGGFEHKTAKGRKTAAGDIVGHIFEDYQASMTRSIDNGVRQKLAALVRANPELGTVEKARGDIRERTHRDGDKMIDGGRDNIVLFKENGVPMVITLNGELGKGVAAAITGRNMTHVPKWFKAATRLSAGMATEYSPTFSFRNFQKDQIALAEIVFAERGAKDGAKWMGHYEASHKDTYGAVFKFATTGKIDTTTKGGKILQDFIDNGGMIGGYERETLGDVSKSLSYDEIVKAMKRGKSMTRAACEHTLKSVSYINKISELMSRVNSFEAERRMGVDKDGRSVTDKSAALFARRALVDFNQGGEFTGISNAWKMFSNSALGANARAIQAATANRHGAAVIGAMAVWGAAQAAINHFINSDDDEREKKGLPTGKDVGEHEHRTSFLNVRVGDKAYKIGQHEDVFTLASYFGNVIARCAMGELTNEQAAKNLGVSVAEIGAVFTGLGDLSMADKGSAKELGKSIALYLTPSLLQPIAEIMTNQDYAGRKIALDEFPNDETPRSEKGRKNTPEYAKTTARAINSATGGNENRRGWLDVPPEYIQKMVEGFGKNALKDVMNIYETAKAILGGRTDELATNLQPVKRDFVRDVPDSTNRFYERKADVDADINEFKKGRKAMSIEEAREYVSKHPWVRDEKRINAIATRITELQKLENGKVKSGRGWVDAKSEPSKDRTEKWKAERLALQAKFLEATKAK